MINSNDLKNFRRVGGTSSDRQPFAMGISRPRALYTALGTETSLDLSLLSTPLSYNPGKATLEIKSSAGSMLSGVDFFETSATTVSFANPLTLGEILEITVTLQLSGNSVAQVRSDEYSLNNAAAATSTVTTDFSFPYNMNPSKRHGSILVFINGILQQRNANNASSGGDADYYEVNLSTGNTNQITFTTPLIGGENVTITRPYQVMDDAAASTTFNNSRLSDIQSGMTEGFQAFVQSSNTIAVPSTTIVNRAKIPDLSQNLKAHFGIERIMTQNLFQLQDEFGPNGEPVWGVVNDTFGQVRFVGSGWSSNASSVGSEPSTNGVNDYIEITFYGTGLNWLAQVGGTSANIQYSINGGSLNGSNIYPSGSSVLNNRNYAQNVVVSVVTAQTLGVYTIKLSQVTVGSFAFAAYGFEVLNESSSIKVNPGVSYVNGKKITTAAQVALAYNSTFESGALGTKGGRVTLYQKADGTPAKKVTPVDATALYLTNASHANEEVARTYHWREFGAGRADDFSRLSTAIAAAFTLDDGTTTLITDAASAVAAGAEALRPSGTGNFVTFTYIGSGLDVNFVAQGASASGTYTVIIDGVTQGTTSSITYASGQKVMLKICSGLPYGTHTVKLVKTATGVSDFSILSYVVYQPKKLAVLTGEVEIADYNVMADYTALTGHTIPSGGVLTKACTREFVYTGAWAAITITTVYNVSGFYTASTTIGDTVSYTFFGYGIECIVQNAGTNASVSVKIDDILYTGAATPVAAGGGGTWTPGTSTWAFGAISSVLNISGLALGKHKVTITNLTTNDVRMVAVSIITPIHSHKSNIAADYQNTLSVGSNGISDNRLFSPLKNGASTKKNWAQAVGITSSPTTISTSPIPMQDMSVTLKTNGGDLKISYSGQFSNSILASSVIVQAYVNGVAVGSAKATQAAVASNAQTLYDSFRLPVQSGSINKIDLYWYVDSGTATAILTRRNVLVEEV